MKIDTFERFNGCKKSYECVPLSKCIVDFYAISKRGSKTAIASWTTFSRAHLSFVRQLPMYTGVYLLRWGTVVQPRLHTLKSQSPHVMKHDPSTGGTDWIGDVICRWKIKQKPKNKRVLGTLENRSRPPSHDGHKKPKVSFGVLNLSSYKYWKKWRSRFAFSVQQRSWYDSN